MKKNSRLLNRFRLQCFAVVTLLAIVTGSFSCSSKAYSGPTESIKVAYSPYLETAFFWIADDRQFFAENGLNVNFVKYDALVPAVDALLKGEVDIVGNVTEFPLASRALQQAPISTIVSIARSQTIYLVGRKDRGISQLSDLKGKRVGTLPGTITDFSIGRLLELNGMSIKDITTVDVKTAAGSVPALVNGDVDAIVVGQPYANSAIVQLGSNAFSQSAQSGQQLYALAVSTDDWITNHPELTTRFLKSLAQAEEFLVQHPTEAKAIIGKRLNLDEAYINSIWPQYTFSLSLDQRLILAMEDEARWLIGNNLTTAKNVPNFLNYIYTAGLRVVEPAALKIAGQ